MRRYATGAELAKDTGMPLKRLAAAHQVHWEAAEKARQDPEGGPWTAYPSGTSWDEPSGRTGHGKRFFANAISGSAVASEPFHAAVVTPVVHYCAGGLEIGEMAEVIGQEGPIPGLYAAGEAAGGVHGSDPLGGNTLLDCVVFGRLAARSACTYAFGEDDEFRPCPLPG